MSNIINTLESSIDSSVNFIEDAEIGFFESRFVQRSSDYFIAYLSSQTGCDQACRMCHLTSTGQLKFQNSTLIDFIKQANNVIEHHKKTNINTENYSSKMHFNFMSRGEALNNPILRDKDSFNELIDELEKVANKVSASPRYLISTIIPKSFDKLNFQDIMGDRDPHIYYSLYSVNHKFRKKWLGNSLDFNLALEKLSKWNEKVKERTAIHFAFIENENDSEEDVIELAYSLVKHDLIVPINIVRYNPYSEKYGKETDIEVIKVNTKIIEDITGIKPKIIERVGFDVKASCGMFVKK
jgi:adenine C2-methylase RlmN of 23S rRNA A2503 and tRNA A37